MKFKVTMKDPDTLHDAIFEAVAEELEKIDGLTAQDREHLTEARHQEALNIAGKWFEYSEYLTVEIDTDARTAVVVPRS